MSTVQFFESAWDLKPSVLAGCAALLLGYAALVRFRFRPRALAWLGGVLIILLALVSPLDELADHYLFSAHMAKHILLVLIAPGLLIIGMPEGAFESLLRHRRIASVERLLRRPAVAWLAGIGAMAFWHVPAIFNSALANEPLHILEHLSLLIGGTIYWWPVLSPRMSSRLNPVPEAAAYLFSSCLACTSIGIVITFAPRLLYPEYLQPADTYGILGAIREGWGISAPLDQQIGGLLMWVPGCLIYLTAIMAMFSRWYAEEQKVTVEA